LYEFVLETGARDGLRADSDAEGFDGRERRVTINKKERVGVTASLRAVAWRLTWARLTLRRSPQRV